jgi:hypothetical protein
MTTVKELLNCNEETANKVNLINRLSQMARTPEELETLKKTMAEIERRAKR